MKIEMHSHIMEQSSDSQISASDYIYLLKEYGYKGIVSTDHFLSSELSNTDGDGFKENVVPGYLDTMHCLMLQKKTIYWYC